MWGRFLQVPAIYAVTGLMLLPVIWMIGTSLKPPIEYVSSSVDLLPDAATLAHYRQLLEENILGKLANMRFERAAVRERVAVSALSRHLANLEAELGTPLFERLPRGVRPTASGARLYDHARTILRSMLFSAICMTKLLSIFNSPTGSFFR